MVPAKSKIVSAPAAPARATPAKPAKPVPSRRPRLAAKPVVVASAAPQPAPVEAVEIVQVAEAGDGAGKKAPAGKRKRLAKAFTRPLDKKLKKSALVRERFTFPDAEFARLVAIKKRLAASGISIKKSELLRAGLFLLDAVDDETLKAVLARIPPVA